MRYHRTLIVIPTRNRSDLAKNAIRSVLDQIGSDVDVLVSDNSTTSNQLAELSQYCEQCADVRLRYITPPELLPMSSHWDWAMQQALSLYDCSHVAFLTDRMMFRPGALGSLIEIVRAYPDKLLTYMHDHVNDFSLPVVLHQYTWTGNLYEVASQRLLELSAQSVMYDTSMPRMLNCLVPRTMLETLKDRFGNVFASIAPDWNFAYRSLEVVDSLLFYDKAALVHYGQNRSNGQSAHFGIINEAYAKFLADLGSVPVNFAAPFPEVVTVWNAIISEYCHVKDVTKSPKFPELDMDKYMQALAVGIDSIKDPQRQQNMRELLSERARCWQDENPRMTSPGNGDMPPSQPEYDDQANVERFSTNNFEFPNLSEALDFALKHSRDRSVRSNHEQLIQGLQRPLPKALHQET
jgi:glycosyltransferase involved in cell wall biosynthesis